MYARARRRINAYVPGNICSKHTIQFDLYIHNINIYTFVYAIYMYTCSQKRWNGNQIIFVFVHTRLNRKERNEYCWILFMRHRHRSVAPHQNNNWKHRNSKVRLWFLELKLVSTYSIPLLLCEERGTFLWWNCVRVRRNSKYSIHSLAASVYTSFNGKLVCFVHYIGRNMCMYPLIYIYIQIQYTSLHFSSFILSICGLLCVWNIILDSRRSRICDIFWHAENYMNKIWLHISEWNCNYRHARIKTFIRAVSIKILVLLSLYKDIKSDGSLECFQIISIYGLSHSRWYIWT